jgi:hypothetical protein
VNPFRAEKSSACRIKSERFWARERFSSGHAALVNPDVERMCGMLDVRSTPKGYATIRNVPLPGNLHGAALTPHPPGRRARHRCQRRSDRSPAAPDRTLLRDLPDADSPGPDEHFEQQGQPSRPPWRQRLDEPWLIATARARRRRASPALRTTRPSSTAKSFPGCPDNTPGFATAA